MFRFIAVIGVAFGFGVAIGGPAAAQGVGTVTARYDAWIPGTSETMNGRIRLKVLRLRGTVKGRTSKGATCSGTVTINKTFRRGTGRMTCSDGQKGNFTYNLSSRRPPRGTGIGKMNNGKTVKFRIKP